VVVACLYLPNGNPQPGPKFDYKLAWFERLIAACAALCDSGIRWCWRRLQRGADRLRHLQPASWRKDALLQPESRALVRGCWRRAGPTRSAHLHRTSAIYTFWDYFRQHWERNAGLRIDHLLLNRELGAVPGRSRCRYLGARRREGERPRAHLGRAGPGPARHQAEKSRHPEAPAKRAA
jgi:exodeoxyribonuclease-3